MTNHADMFSLSFACEEVSFDGMMSLCMWAKALILSSVVGAVSVLGEGPMCGCEHRYGVLMEFYDSTNGPSWGNPVSSVQGWNTSISCNQSWTGVFCTRGDVYMIVLDGLRVNGPFPSILANLTALLELKMPNNQITGTLPPSFNLLKQLYLLDVQYNAISGTLPSEWSSFDSLTTLWAFSNSITGTLPPAWSAMKNLQILDLSINSLIGILPPEWSQMSSLHVLTLSKNALSGTLPATWSILVKLETLQLQNNGFSGTLPSDWCSLSSMRALDLSLNSFEGTLHASWSNMSLLETLKLSSNQLSGSLPSPWAIFSKLSQLDLSNNHLSGTLPEHWAEMGSTLPLLYGPFLTLMLSFNALEGTLPVAWSNFSKIFWLSVSHNDVFGTLPASWLQQKTLSTLELNDNLLSGSIPLGDNTSTVLMLLNVCNNCFIGTLNRTVRTTLTVDVCNTHVHEGSALSTCASRLSQRWPQECNSQSQSLSLQVSRSRSTQPTSTFVLGGPSATQRPSSSGELKASISATIMFLHDPSSPLPSLATAASSPIAATAVISAVSGVDSGSAQALLTILDSACSCTSPTRSLPRQRQGVQYQEVEQRSSVPRAASLALSPLVLIGDSVGPFEVVIGNVALCIGMLFVQCTVVVVHHLRCTDDDESQVAEKNGVSVNHKPLSHDRVLNVHHIACSPSGALFRFPSATLRLTAFLVAGIVWGVAQLLSSPDFFTDNGAEEGNLDDLFEDAQGFDTITVLLGTCIGIVFLVCLGAILYVVVLHSWILDGAQGLQFEPFARVRGNTNPFSPPFPSRVASVLCSREGQWAPIPRRAAFGSPIATPFMPWCLKWAWAIGPTTSLIAVALSTAAPPSRHRTRACDGIQAVLICLYIVTAAVFAKLLPHRSIMRSLLAAFSNTLNGAVVVLSLLCRYELVGRDSPFIVASVGGYMSLCGSVLMFVVDRLEQRVLQGQQGEQAASSANSRRQSQHQHSRIDIRAYSAEQHDDVLRLQQLAALQRLIELAANVTDMGQ